MIWEYADNHKLEIIYQKDNKNIEKLNIRFEQLKQYINTTDKTSDTSELVKLTLDSCSLYLNHYYKKCNQALTQGIVSEVALSDNIILKLFNIFDNILMYCYALESNEYTKYKEEYISSRNFLQSIYDKCKDNESAKMKVFVIPFNGTNSLRTEHYFYKYPYEDVKKLGLSIDELMKEEDFTTICVVLDSHYKIANKEIFIPIAIHEISHYIRLIERKQRNEQLLKFLIESISREIAGHLISMATDEIPSTQGRVRKVLQKNLQISLLELFYQYLKEQNINLNKIKYIDFLKLFKDFYDNYFDFGTNNEVVIFDSSNIFENIKKVVLELQTYLYTPISFRYESLKTFETHPMYLEKLYCTMFYDLVFEKKIDYWEQIKLASFNSYLLDDERINKKNKVYYNSICELIKHKKEYIDKKPSKEYFIHFGNGLVNYILSDIYSIELYKYNTSKDKHERKIAKQLSEFIGEAGEDSFTKKIDIFEDGLSKIFQENKQHEVFKCFIPLIHRIIEIKQYLTAYELLVSSYCSEKEYSNIHNNEVAKKCFLQLRLALNEMLIDKHNNEDFMFLMTPVFKNAFFRLGLFSDNNVNQFSKHFNETIRIIGEKNLLDYTQDQINLYKESFADLFMCWTLNLDSTQYDNFFNNYAQDENMFLPKPQLGNNFSKSRQNIVKDVLNNGCFDKNYINTTNHFKELYNTWQEKSQQSISDICKDYCELIPFFRDVK